MALMIKYHCPKIVEFLGEDSVSELLDDTYYFYPPVTARRSSRNELDVVILQHSPDDFLKFRRSTPTQILRTPVVRSSVSKHRSSTASIRFSSNVAVIGNGVTSGLREVIVIDDSPFRVEFQPNYPVTDTNWSIPSSKRLDQSLDVTIIVWVNPKKSEHSRMLTAALNGRKGGTFVLSDHKVVMYKKTGLVVYDDIQIRQGKRWETIN